VLLFQLLHHCAFSLQTPSPLHPSLTTRAAASPSFVETNHHNQERWFTVIPPSTNPRSKLNQACYQEIQDKLQVLHPPIMESGRIRFAVSAALPNFSSWGTLLQSSGIRSVRAVPFWEDVDVAPHSLNENGDDDIEVSHDLSLVMKQIVNGTDWISTLDLWKQFGNTHYKNEPQHIVDTGKVELEQHHHPLPSVLPPPIHFHVKVKKLQGTVFRTYSTSHLSRQFVTAVKNNSQLGDWMIPTLQKKASAMSMPVMEIHVLLHNNTSASIEIPVLVPPSAQQQQSCSANSPTTNMFHYNELPHPGFKRVESWAIVKTASIQSNEVVLDPMCGRGTFLVEGAMFWPNAKKYVGVDCCPEQLAKANLNIQHAFGNHLINSNKSFIHVRHGNAQSLHGIHDKSIDKIICCPPFGRQFFTVVDNNGGSSNANENRQKDEENANQGMLYKELLAEWCRVLKDDITSKMVLVIDGGLNLDYLMDAIDSAHCQVTELRTFRLGPQLRGNIVVVTKQQRGKEEMVRRSRNKDRESLRVSNHKLQWELDAPLELQQSYRDRALWSILRSRMIPALVPVCPETN